MLNLQLRKKMNLPPFNKFPKLSSEKILLREILVVDIPDIVEISYYNGKQAENLTQAMDMQESINQGYILGNSIHWGIINRTSNEIMGTCGYYRGFKKGTGELGFILLANFRRQGIMTEALKLAIDLGINKMKLHRIVAITGKQNHNAIKLLERLNFRVADDLQNEEIKYEIKLN